MQPLGKTQKVRRTHSTPGACFSKVPKLLRPISGSTIAFISSQHRGSKPSNFTVLLKNMSKDQRCKTSELHFANWLFGLEKFSGRLRNRPQLLRVVAISVRMRSTVSTEQRQVTMDNCFGLVRPHQHGVDDTCRGGL